MRVLDAGGPGVNTSRAAVIHARTLEALEAINVTPELFKLGLRVPTFSIRNGLHPLAALDFSALSTNYPYTLMLPQSDTEQILLTRLAELGGRVDWHHTVQDVQVHGSGARLQVGTVDGTTLSLDSQYVIGADGLHSQVRHAAGIDFDGDSYDQQFLLADVRMDWSLPNSEVQLFFHTDGLVVVAPLPRGRHRIVATTDVAVDLDSRYLQQLLTTRTVPDAQVREVIWASQFTVQHRLATQYRSGPLFIVGDAAHVHSPAGGQGMNLGIQDAVCLGNLMADVVTGAAHESTLDMYETLRRPIARDVVRLTDRLTRIATIDGLARRWGRNAAVSMLLKNARLRNRIASQIAGLRPKR